MTPEFLIVMQGGSVSHVVDLEGTERWVAIMQLQQAYPHIATLRGSSEIPDVVTTHAPSWKNSPEFFLMRLCEKIANKLGAEPVDVSNGQTLLIVKGLPLSMKFPYYENRVLIGQYMATHVSVDGYLIANDGSGKSIAISFRDLPDNVYEEIEVIVNKKWDEL